MWQKQWSTYDTVVLTVQSW